MACLIKCAMTRMRPSDKGSRLTSKKQTKATKPTLTSPYRAGGGSGGSFTLDSRRDRSSSLGMELWYQCTIIPAWSSIGVPPSQRSHVWSLPTTARCTRQTGALRFDLSREDLARPPKDMKGEGR